MAQINLNTENLRSILNEINNLPDAGSGGVNNGDVSAVIDGLTTTSITIPAGYTTGGTIRLTTDIEMALSEI